MSIRMRLFPHSMRCLAFGALVSVSLPAVAVSGCSSASSASSADAGSSSLPDGGGTSSEGGGLGDSGLSASCHPTLPSSSCAAGKVALGVPTSLKWPTGFNVNSVVAGDLNGDGKTDIVAFETPNGIDVYLNGGDGTFASPVHYDGQASGTDSVVIADFNGDCVPDVMGVGAGNAFLFWKGKGDGTFAPETETPGPNNGLSLRAADLNGDGRIDYVLDESSALVGLNKGDGTFAQVTVAWNANVHIDSFDIGDVDGDGAPDLAFSQTVVQGTGAACYLPNTGSGSFGAPKCVPVKTGTNPAMIGIADLDGDGKNDLVVKTDQIDTVSVFLGKGGGTFGDRVEYALAGDQAFRVVDVDHDGRPDLVAYNANKSVINVLVNKGDGTFPNPVIAYPAGGPTAYSNEQMVVGDFLGNGLVGFAVNNRANGSIDVVNASCRP